jgi:hypothetical protein
MPFMKYMPDPEVFGKLLSKVIRGVVRQDDTMPLDKSPADKPPAIMPSGNVSYMTAGEVQDKYRSTESEGYKRRPAPKRTYKRRTTYKRKANPKTSNPRKKRSIKKKTDKRKYTPINPRKTKGFVNL